MAASRTTENADNWHPITGDETAVLLRRKGFSQEANERLVSEAIDVLSSCVSPSLPAGQRTGLVIGYVQSGKTLSFTTVAALARDNGFRVIIVLSGLTRNLFGQSLRRVDRDLDVVADRRRWISIGNPTFDPDTVDRLLVVLRSRPSGRASKTILLTVMKNRTHLDNLAELLGRLPMEGIPTLVVDDEADQASLNNEVREGGMSATYKRLLALRKVVPHHTYLQYTATPQAPLLINLIDVLSPSFVKILTPGMDYTGGQTFFSGERDLIVQIPDSDIPTADNEVEYPPQSLIDSLAVFLIGVAAGRLEGEHDDGDNRSMMVHPAMRTQSHLNYKLWVRSIRNSWRSVFEAGARNPSDPDYVELAELYLKHWIALKRTEPTLPAFDQILEELPMAISETRVVELNARQIRAPQVDWVADYANILVGGEMLNRGFTVEGLTVSYMPRSLGTHQADTIQQRARWFGYKADYLGLCRVYLPPNAIEAFSAYIEHEELLRSDLKEFSSTAKPLSEWRRAFFLDRDLRPTRMNVLDIEYERGNFSDKWFRSDFPHIDEELVVWNRAIVSEFSDRHSKQIIEDDGRSERTVEQRHWLIPNLDLQVVYSSLLSRLRFASNADSTRLTGLLLQVDRYLEINPGARARVYYMHKAQARRRRIGENGAIDQLFQGYSPAGAAPRDRIYPGDDKIKQSNELSVQVHHLDVLNQRGDRIISKDVPAVAIWVPRSFSAAWLVQPA